MATIYTVQKGDTLSHIALKYDTTVAKLVEWNNITDPDYIVVGQKLTVDGAATAIRANLNMAIIKAFGLQSNTDRTVYATWLWTRANTEKYNIIWYYDTGDGVWFEGSNTTTTIAQCVYNAPSNANRVKFKVQPVAESYTVGRATRAYWIARWSTEVTYNFSDNPPTKPPVPTLTLDTRLRRITATLNNLKINATSIQFQMIRNDTTIVNTLVGNIKTGTATCTFSAPSGYRYKVRCRGYRTTTNEYGPWSDYTENMSTVPNAPTYFLVCRAQSRTSIYMEWEPIGGATSYDIEYAIKKEYFDGSDQTTVKNNITSAFYLIEGLETGHEYFLRIRSVNGQGHSEWSKISSVILGKDPAAPTTWSSTTTAIVGDPLTLYWVHNSEDNSSQTVAELELIVGGVTKTLTIENSTDEEEKDKTSAYEIDTSEYDEGTKILWRVRTAGITRVYGDWSVQRTVDVYSRPTLGLSVTDLNGEMLEVLEYFPIRVVGMADPKTQQPIGYHVAITALESYNTTDEVGNMKTISVGESVYSSHFNVAADLSIDISASDVDLENNISYKLTCSVTMDSGLTAEGSVEFKVGWSVEEFEPNLEIIFDHESYTASLRPYCEDDSGNLIENVMLSVYRREYDGRFTELATELDNLSNTYITDPHPSLDMARYRVVATSTVNGSIGYYDVPGYPVNGTSVIIQWDEDWTSFDTWNNDIPEDKSWSGSMLKLPYNIDVSDSNSADVSLVGYIGRSHPVGYYGTQLGTTSTWNVVIPKNDKETLYGLRRLAVWMGNVYVREPSGNGYWANIQVSYSIKHCEVTIPVTLSITRVEGGA